MRSTSIFKSLLIAGLALSATIAHTEVLSPDEALGRALPQIRNHAPSLSNKLELVYSESTPKKNSPAVYVFGRKDTYYIISADDNAEPLLGYADTAFDPTNIPPSLKWWIGEYARQIEAASESSPKTIMKASRESISPMIHTLWDQGSPYNNLCPLYSGERAVTGCAATAMAQVMKYFNYPAKGKGSKSYTSNGKAITMNFANVSFDWQNMLDRYHGVDATDTEKTAVASLMYACGVSIEMQYSAYESGATDMVVPNALVNYFSYDKGVRYFMRDYYTTAQWEELVYNQLATCGPVQYSGISNEGGHSFVCDGYSSDGFFHINWGWSGMSDGYYLLTALEPGQQGIGGSLSGFNFDQSVVGEVREPRTGSTTYPEFYIISNFDIPAKTLSTGSSITVNAQVANYSYATTTATFGLKFVNQQTGEASYTAGSTTVQLRQGYMIEHYYLTMPMKAAGTYTVTPALRASDGAWYDIPVKKAFTGSYTFTVGASGTTVSANKPGSLVAENLDLKTKIYLSQDFNLGATIKNPAEDHIYATIAPALVSGNNILAIGEYMYVSLESGKSKDIDYIGSFDHTSSSWTPTGGNYKLCILNVDTNEAISDVIDVTVNNKPTNTSLAISNFTIEGGLTNVDASNVRFTGTVSCRAGFFGGRLDVAIFPYTDSGSYSIASLPAKPLFLGVFQSGSLDASGRLMDVEVGKSYMAAVFNGTTQISNVIVFTIGANSDAVDDVEIGQITLPRSTDGYISFDNTVDMVNIYSLSGMLLRQYSDVSDIDISDLNNGIYIIELSTAGIKNVQRIVKH